MDTTVSVTGRALYADVNADVDQGEAELDAGWTVNVGRVPLETTWISPERLEVLVPAGFEAGVYDVVAMSPDGRRARLEEALTVVEEPVGFRLSIEDAPGGTGLPLEQASLTTDGVLTAYAVARDADGAFVGDVTATWTVSGGVGTVPAAPSSSASFDPTSPGSGALVASNDFATAGDSVTLTVSAGLAASLVVTPASVTVTADDAPFTFAVNGLDADGNPTPNVGTVTFSVEGSFGTVDPLIGLLTPELAGDGLVRVTSSLGIDIAVPAEIAPGRAVSFGISPPVLSVSADDPPVAFSVVNAVDADGNATDDVGMLAWSVASGGISAVDPVTGVFTPVAAGSGIVEVISVYGPTASSGVTVAPGIAAALTVAPDTLAVTADDAPVTFSVSAEDADGNPTPEVGTITWTVPSGSITSLDPGTGTLTPTTAGSGRVRATSSHGVSDDSATVTIAPGALASVTVSPSSITVSADDAPLVFTASGTDADGNATGPGTVTWSIAAGPISVIDPSTGAFTPATAGSGTVRATSSLGPAGNSSVSVTPGRAITMDVQPDSVTVTADAAAFAFSAAGADADGNPTTDLGTLTWSIASGPIGDLDAGGLFTPNIAGTGSVRVTSGYGATDDSGPVTVLPGHAAMLTVQPETLSTHEAELPTAFAVSAIDSDGNATADVGTLTWSIASGPISSIDAATGVFTPVAVGTGRVRAASSWGPADESGDVVVADGALVVLDDPFADGSPFAYVAGFEGLVHLGPNRDGTAAFRVQPDGTSPELLSFSFSRDLSGNTSRNVSPSPYSSIGSSGCAAGTVACGPDDEDGRGLFGSVTLNGQEWLVVGGARSGGDLDYLYATPAGGSALDFRYIDISSHVSGGTRGFTSMHAFDGHVYVGLAADGGNRPAFVDLEALPAAPGLDASSSDATDLEAYDMPEVPGPEPAMLDVITDFNGRVYIANAGGWMKAAVSEPGPYDPPLILPILLPSDWDDCEPSASAFTSKASRTTTKTSALFPADKSVPQMAAWNGRLYAARNTTSGPQLWRCGPGGDGQCDPGEWTLVAPNSTGDTQLTQFDNANNTSITLLAATESFLYVAFDNAVDGIVVFRTAAAVPSTQGDFAGAGGCSAANHPASCEGFGGNGLGLPSATRILDAKALTFGPTTRVFATVGDGVAPFSLVRLQP